MRIKHKKQILMGLLGFISICLIISLLYTFVFSESDYTISHQEVHNQTLPHEFNQFHIAYISDIHIKNKEDIQRFKKIITQLNEKTYDLILFGGDLYVSNVYEPHLVSKILKDIPSNHGKFAVLGDEDESKSSEITAILNDGGFEVLNNEKRNILKTQKTIHLYGMSTKGDTSILDKSSYNLLLTHYPDDFTKYAPYCQLQLSGHTGGGYIKLPLLGGLIKSKHGSQYVNGHYSKENAQLIISNGVSTTSQNKYRFLTRNEITTLTLTR